MPRSKDPHEMIVGMADCWKDTVQLAEAPLRFDNDLLLKAFREFLAALTSALYIFFSSSKFPVNSLRVFEERIAAGKVGEES